MIPEPILSLKLCQICRGAIIYGIRSFIIKFCLSPEDMLGELWWIEFPMLIYIVIMFILW